MLTKPSKHSGIPHPFTINTRELIVILKKPGLTAQKNELIFLPFFMLAQWFSNFDAHELS